MNIIKTSIFVIVLSFIIHSCTTNDDTTVILLGKENYVEEVNKIIPDTLLDVFESYFGTINTGYIPPNIEGTYILNPKKRVYSNISTGWPLDVVEPELKLTISEQHNRVCIMEIDEYVSTVTDTAYISGYDNFFTVYLTERKALVYSGCETDITRNIICKGEITPNGIKNLHIATVILDVEDDSHGNIVQYNEGDFFIYKDADSFSNLID